MSISERIHKATSGSLEADTRIKELFPDKGYTREKFTFQLSDHFPLWVQIKTDIDGERLSQIVQSRKKEPQ